MSEQARARVRAAYRRGQNRERAKLALLALANVVCFLLMQSEWRVHHAIVDLPNALSRGWQWLLPFGIAALVGTLVSRLRTVIGVALWSSISFTLIATLVFQAGNFVLPEGTMFLLTLIVCVVAIHVGLAWRTPLRHRLMWVLLVPLTISISYGFMFAMRKVGLVFIVAQVLGVALGNLSPRFKVRVPPVLVFAALLFSSAAARWGVDHWPGPEIEVSVNVSSAALRDDDRTVGFARFGERLRVRRASRKDFVVSGSGLHISRYNVVRGALTVRDLERLADTFEELTPSEMAACVDHACAQDPSLPWCERWSATRQSCRAATRRRPRPGHDLAGFLESLLPLCD